MRVVPARRSLGHTRRRICPAVRRRLLLLLQSIHTFACWAAAAAVDGDEISARAAPMRTGEVHVRYRWGITVRFASSTTITRKLIVLFYSLRSLVIFDSPRNCWKFCWHMCRMLHSDQGRCQGRQGAFPPIVEWVNF